ncbi:MAG: sulfite exporter TauE/SafE family protein [Candidatus Omnitrophica bacterium]|nr:sulfite exporter TauE/SafE family protein [Candidatus Omnitrophota bacterium]
MNLLGNPLDFILAFFWGLAVSFTPCIYPLIPITAGYIGANASGSRMKGFVLSLFYTTGMAITYSILGIFAVLTGSLFGRVSSHPVTHIILGVAIIVFALSMLGLFKIPIFGITRLPRIKKKNYFSAFILGLASGLIVSPCLTPALASILAYLATKRNLLYGAFLLFSFAYGMGAVLILIGTFSGMLANLPKSGNWLMYIKRICAAIMMAAAIYFIYTGIGRL